MTVVSPTPIRPRSDFEVFRRAYPEFVRHVQSLRKMRERDFGHLAALTGQAKRNRARQLLLFPSLHLLYAYEATRRLRRLRSTPPPEIKALASRCNPLQRSDEDVTPSLLPGRVGWRSVANFGPIKRARQMLVADMLRSLHPPLENQFLFRGGMPMAFRAVETAISDGFTFGSEIDIVNFYGSVRLEGLADMLRPLPASAVEHVVWERETRPGVCTGVSNDDAEASMEWAYPSLSGLTGLAMGSACSPIVGERIIARLLAPVDQCQMVTYADNILVLGRTREAVDATLQEMQARAERLVGWPLRLRNDGISDLTMPAGFRFLHHHASREGENFIWAPDERKLGHFLLAEEEGDDLSLTAIEKAENRVAHWRRAYPSWPDGDLWETTQLAALAARRFYLASTPLNKSRAVQGAIASYFANGRLRPFDDLTPSGNSPRDDTRRSELIAAAEQALRVLAHAGRIDHTNVRFLG